jgi:hypothetical protein
MPVREALLSVVFGATACLGVAGCSGPDPNSLSPNYECLGAIQAWEGVVAQAAADRQACSDDADCVLRRPHLQCASGGADIDVCDVAVAASEAAAFDADLVTEGPDVCASVSDCRWTPDCGGTASAARCATGTCTVEWEVPRPGP